MFQPSGQFLAQLARHEGYRATPYLCAAGVCTIGYGTNLEAHPKKIPFADIREKVSAGTLKGARLVAALTVNGLRWTKHQAEEALLEEVNACHEALLARCDAYRELRESYADARSDVLLNMAFNLGVDGLLAFRATLEHARAGRYAEAARGMLASKWAGQVKGRAQELALQMENGRYAS